MRSALAKAIDALTIILSNSNIIMSNNPSLQRHNQTLFDKDGVSLFATILSPTTNNNSDDDHGIILTLSLSRQHEKNVVNPTLISLLIQALDIIDTHPLLVNTNNKSLIITGLVFDDNFKPQTKTTKFFSNGLDLEWMLQAKGTSTKSPTSTLIESYNSQVLARILTLPFTTIAAINGHWKVCVCVVMCYSVFKYEVSALDTSYELVLPIFVFLYKLHVLTFVAITSLSSS